MGGGDAEHDGGGTGGEPQECGGEAVVSGGGLLDLGFTRVILCKRPRSDDAPIMGTVKENGKRKRKDNSSVKISVSTVNVDSEMVSIRKFMKPRRQMLANQ